MLKAISVAKFNNQSYDQDSCYNIGESRLTIMSDLVKPGSTVLDLGCGTGLFMKLIAPKCKSITGLEISKKAAAIGKKRYLNIKVGDVHQSFPFATNSFDTVTAGEIIEHIYDTDFFLEEIKRVLRPRGSLIISTPNIATLGRRLMLLLGINPLIETSLKNAAGHIRYFTKDSLVDLLTAHKFKTTEFTSDTVNFTNTGRLQSQMLAKIFPTLGARLIIKAQNIKNK